MSIQSSREPRLKIVNDGHGDVWALRFRCPGCNDIHQVSVNWTPPGSGRKVSRYNTGKSTWQFNGDLAYPTFYPSVDVKTGHYCNVPPVPGKCACDFQERYPEEEPWKWPCYHCHSWVRDGKIQFLADCTHALAGQTVELPPLQEGDEK